jgi:hypothetical protein
VLELKPQMDEVLGKITCDMEVRNECKLLLILFNSNEFYHDLKKKLIFKSGNNAVGSLMKMTCRVGQNILILRWLLNLRRKSDLECNVINVQCC